MDNLIRRYIEKLRLIHNLNEYNVFIKNIEQELHEQNYESEIINAIRFKAKYDMNRFSNDSSIENMEKSKENLLHYLETISRESNKKDSVQVENLYTYLSNFYSFLEALKEKMPHKKATLKPEVLSEININNEYDLQHLLYSVLKPLWQDARIEVSEDTGFAQVRTDISISSINAVIETKCTRKSMNERKLTEEIGADIVHYKAEHIFFYVYDKEKIIKDRIAFEGTYNMIMGNKHVYMILFQPVNI